MNWTTTNSILCVFGKPSAHVMLRVLQKTRKEEDQVMQFFQGLNDNYNNIKSHVQLLEPTPPIRKVFALVTQQEKNMCVESIIVATKINGGITANTSIICTFWG